MNILIMDDDEYTVETVKAMIDWETIGVDNVFSATTVFSAKQIYEAADLDIMLCDIEMHDETGLDFVEWARKQGSLAEVIFLTSFAEFSYAQKALQLQSMEYVLKPVKYDELSEILKHAVVRAGQIRKERGEQEKWKQSLKLRKEGFWKRLISREVTEQEEVERHRRFLELSYTREERFLFFVIEIYDFCTILEKVERGMYDFIIQNITEELLGTKGFCAEVIWRMDAEDAARWHVILRVEEQTIGRYREAMMQIGQNYIAQIRQKLDSIVGCYVGMPVCYAQIPGQAQTLLEMVQDDVLGAGQVRFLENYSFGMVSYIQPEFASWEKLILEKEEQQIRWQISQYLSKLEKEKNANSESLGQFRMEFDYMILSVLKKRNIPASLLWDDIHADQNKDAVKSIHNMQRYAKRLCDKALCYMNQVDQEKSIVYTVKAYISEHYAEELTRDDMAQLVYLNPDYLSRIFRSETGESLSNYLIRFRIDRAKELLISTSQPIHQIACSVGYTNFSYFAKLFRKYTQCTPNEYRKKTINNTNQ
ncbi:MAG: helix-turn-helix domain-containing protein [Roseburia sp.]|jgi:two-component system response regulator YesN|nr:helix-turn-helix domain-containing protein [Roseburia sp.]